MSETVNSPDINGLISSMMRASASVKLSASTSYGSVTFLFIPFSITFSYLILHSNQVCIAIIVSY